MKKFVFLFASLSALALSGCVSQEQADAKMANGCSAAMTAQLGTDVVKDAKMTGSGATVLPNGEYRKIEMTYIDDSSFDQTPKQANCLFSEQWGPAKTSHTALLEQMTVNDTLYGKKDGVVQGALEDFLKLTDAASQAMGQ